MDSTVG